MATLDDDRPAPAHLMESVEGDVPKKTVRVCLRDGCDRPVTRRRRNYCSRHRRFDDIDYFEKLQSKPDVRIVRRMARQLHAQERAQALAHHVDDVRHLVEPIEGSYLLPAESPSIARSITLARRHEALYKDLERAVAPFWSFVSALPAPPRLPLFQRNAREAWLRFHQGDSEPLDSFIRKYLIRLRNHDGPVPGVIRERVVGVLDECFAPVLVYAPGEWYSFGPAAQKRLVDFAKETRKKFGSISYDTEFMDKLSARSRPTPTGGSRLPGL